MDEDLFERSDSNESNVIGNRVFDKARMGRVNLQEVAVKRMHRDNMNAKRRKTDSQGPRWTDVGSKGEIAINKSSVLGAGAFGKVFSGRFNWQPVAVKRMDRDNVDLFQKEIEILMNSSNEYVVEYFFHDKAEDFLYLALEKCNFDLAQYLQENSNAVGGDEDKEIMRQAACGLFYLHSINIIHRDVKLSNFLVKIIDGEPVVKITDFGISRFLDPDKTSTEASVKGTLGYKASEILRGLRLRKISDVFALGIVFYKILTTVNKHPFGENYLDIEVHIRDRYEPDLGDIGDFPRAETMKQLITGMLEHDTGLRYKSIEVKAAVEFMD